MLREIVRRERNAVAVEVGLRRANNDPAGCEFTGDEARILQAADADGKIPAFLDEIDIAVGKAKIDTHGGVETGEIGKGWSDFAEAEGQRHVQPQGAPRLDPVKGGRGFRLLHFG